MSRILFDQIHIPTTNSMRQLRIYMPDVPSGQRLPVLYMHDGQNLFDGKTSYGGVAWEVQQTLDRLIEAKRIPPMMVVGIDNSDRRTFEYSPYKASAYVKKKLYFDVGGDGDQYATFCATTLKDYIDDHYPTHSDRNNTYMAGSSLGGLITAYIASKYPDTYIGFGVFSLASWFNEKAFLSDIRAAHLPKDQQYFITVGNHESSDDSVESFSKIYLENSRNYKDLLIEKGVYDILYQETEDKHNEVNWQKAFPKFIAFLMKNR